jgi:hypothetical protein
MWRVVKETGSGLPIPGVNIQVKIQLMGTATDYDGRFLLKGFLWRNISIYVPRI